MSPDRIVMDAEMPIVRGFQRSQRYLLPCTLVVTVSDDFWAAYRPALVADEQRRATA